MSGSNNWSIERVALLRELWDEGLSTAAIGRRLGTSKNAVIGKAHRLKLPRRPSPLVRHSPGWTEERVEQWKRLQAMRWSQRSIARSLGVSQSWLQKSAHKLGLADINVRPSRPRITLPPLRSVEVAVKSTPVPREPTPLPREPTPLFKPATSFGQCCWVLSNRRYCDEPITTRGPYCDGHRQVAYRPKVDRRTLQEVA